MDNQLKLLIKYNFIYILGVELPLIEDLYFKIIYSIIVGIIIIYFSKDE